MSLIASLARSSFVGAWLEAAVKVLNVGVMGVWEVMGQCGMEEEMTEGMLWGHRSVGLIGGCLLKERTAKMRKLGQASKYYNAAQEYQLWLINGLAGPTKLEQNNEL